jgi:hypothetical protein
VARWAARSSRIEYVERMRTMQIDRFPGEKIEITDLGPLIIERLTDETVVWPQQAVPLVGYMAWPNDAAARGRWLLAHQDNDQSAPSELTRKLKIIQQHWARVADIVHLYFDLVKGRHLVCSMRMIFCTFVNSAPDCPILYERRRIKQNRIHQEGICCDVVSFP